MVLPPLELFSLRRELPVARRLFPFLRPNSPYPPEHHAESPLSFHLIFASPLPSRTATIQSDERQAEVAQLVEQLIRNQQVIGSSPIFGSISFPPPAHLPVQFPAGSVRIEPRFVHFLSVFHKPIAADAFSQIACCVKERLSCRVHRRVTTFRRGNILQKYP